MSAERYRHLRSSVSALTYHFVWCPKYRRKVLLDAVAQRLAALLRERATALTCEIIALELMPDHVHLCLTSPPTLVPQHIVNQMKGYTARVLRADFPHLRSRLPSLWSRSYYVRSTGAVSADTTAHYIAQQQAS